MLIKIYCLLISFPILLFSLYEKKNKQAHPFNLAYVLLNSVLALLLACSPLITLLSFPTESCRSETGMAISDHAFTNTKEPFETTYLSHKARSFY